MFRYLVNCHYRKDDGSGPSSVPTHSRRVSVVGTDAANASQRAIEAIYAYHAERGEECSHVSCRFPVKLEEVK